LIVFCLIVVVVTVVEMVLTRFAKPVFQGLPVTTRTVPPFAQNLEHSPLGWEQVRVYEGTFHEVG
jgi:hypothetical protein